MKVVALNTQHVNGRDSEVLTGSSSGTESHSKGTRTVDGMRTTTSMAKMAPTPSIRYLSSRYF